MAPSKKPATYADIEALPEHLVGEIIDGELVVSPRPAPPHSHSQGVIHANLYDAFDLGRPRPSGWWFLVEPELHLDRQVLVPGIAGWRKDRVPYLPETPAVSIAPDWACEVLSPSTARIDRAKKLGIYRDHGVEYVWLVEPLQRMVELYARRKGEWVVGGMYAGDVQARIPPFAAVELDLTTWWLPRPPGAGTRVSEEPVSWTVDGL